MIDSCGHSWTRLNGYGLAIVPLGPFRATCSQLDDEAPHLDVELTNQRFARILPSDEGYRSKIDPRTTGALSEVVEVTLGEIRKLWRIETTLFGIAWPPGLVLRSDGIEPFELGNDEGLLFYAQSVKQRPDLADLRGPGQTVVEQLPEAEVPSILLSYEHDNQPWMQRHTVFNDGSRHVVVSAQFPAKARQEGEALSGQLCASFRWAS